jgi:hypothetical protein
MPVSEQSSDGGGRSYLAATDLDVASEVTKASWCYPRNCIPDWRIQLSEDYTVHPIIDFKCCKYSLAAAWSCQR